MTMLMTMLMTLSSYSFTSEDEARHPGRGPNPAGWAFALGNALLHLVGDRVLDARGGS